VGSYLTVGVYYSVVWVHAPSVLLRVPQLVVVMALHYDGTLATNRSHASLHLPPVF
jgi:hypothetical protein